MHGDHWLTVGHQYLRHTPISAQVIQQTLSSQVTVDRQTPRWLPGGPHERLLLEPAANVFLSSVCESFFHDYFRRFCETLLRIQIACVTMSC